MKRKIGCLVIHGFGGSTYEISPLAQYLKQRRYYVISPTLEGHTGKREDLRTVKYQDWIVSAEKGLIHLLERCDKVYIIGFSMGGLIATQLATKYGVEGVVMINTPIFYWDIKRIVTNIVEDIKRKEFEHIKRYMKSSNGAPLSALINFRWLLRETKPLVKQMTCPLLVLQSNDDDTVRKVSANYIFDHAASDAKHLNFYDQGGHLILRSDTAQQVIADVHRFIREN